MLSRTELGRIVREAWVERARLKAVRRGEVPRPDHVAPYESISEFDQETDNLIGEAVQNAVLYDNFQNDELKFICVLAGFSFLGGAVASAIISLTAMAL